MAVFAVDGQKQVGELDVAVDHTVFVGLVERFAELFDQGCNERARHGTAGDRVGHGFPVEELHDQECNPQAFVDATFTTTMGEWDTTPLPRVGQESMSPPGH